MKHHQNTLESTLEICVSRYGDLFVQTDPL